MDIDWRLPFNGVINYIRLFMIQPSYYPAQRKRSRLIQVCAFRSRRYPFWPFAVIDSSRLAKSFPGFYFIPAVLSITVVS